MVSIHAPVRERRRIHRSERITRKVSIHAPVRERQPCSRTDGHTSRFNSRSREGATVVFAICAGVNTMVSIHAPVRERHERIAHPTGRLAGFQFTLP